MAKILVVSNNPDFAREFSGIFCGEHVLFYAETSEKALRRLQFSPIDIVVLDRSLSIFSALSIVKQIHFPKRSNSVVLITILQGSDRERHMAFHVGADDVLEIPLLKPVVRSSIQFWASNPAREELAPTNSPLEN